VDEQWNQFVGEVSAIVDKLACMLQSVTTKEEYNQTYTQMCEKITFTNSLLHQKEWFNKTMRLADIRLAVVSLIVGSMDPDFINAQANLKAHLERVGK